MKYAIQYLRHGRPWGGPSIQFDFIGGLVNDIAKGVGNVIEGRDPFAGIGGIAGTVGSIINGQGSSSPSSSGPAAATASATVPIQTASGQTVDIAPFLVIAALVAVLFVSGATSSSTASGS